MLVFKKNSLLQRNSHLTYSGKDTQKGTLLLFSSGKFMKPCIIMSVVRCLKRNKLTWFFLSVPVMKMPNHVPNQYLSCHLHFQCNFNPFFMAKIKDHHCWAVNFLLNKSTDVYTYQCQTSPDDALEPPAFPKRESNSKIYTYAGLIPEVLMPVFLQTLCYLGLKLCHFDLFRS